MWRLKSRAVFYASLVIWTVIFGLVFDYVIATIADAREAWFYALCVMIYSGVIFILTVIRFDQLKRI